MQLDYYQGKKHKYLLVYVNCILFGLGKYGHVRKVVFKCALVKSEKLCLFGKLNNQIDQL